MSSLIFIQVNILRIMSDEGCCICLDEFRESRRHVFTSTCNHSFHLTCIRKVHGTACPYCRTCIVIPRKTKARQSQRQSSNAVYERMRTHHSEYSDMFILDTIIHGETTQPLDDYTNFLNMIELAVIWSAFLLWMVIIYTFKIEIYT